MREFKFKVWDKETNKMYSGDEFRFWQYRAINEVFLENQKRFTFMQYTGLSINDADIYEGDLLEIEEKEYTFIGVVKYESGAWWVCDKESSYADYLNDIYLSEEISFDVVGNIFEGVENNE